MDIDLSKLNNLAFVAIDENKQAPEKPIEPQTANNEYKTHAENKNPLESKIEGLQCIHKLQRQADAKKHKIDRSLTICKEYQQNMNTSSQLQTEILKGAKAGEDIYNLFLKAVKAISIMTSNKLFYDQLETDIIEIYGQGLSETIPLQMELQQTKERLTKLREAFKREPAESIQRAIKAHEKRVTDIESLLHREQTIV